MSANCFPQDYAEKASPVAADLLILGDSEDLDTNGNPNVDKKIQLSSLATLGFAAKDTDDLAEGTTNLYYTDTRVASSAYATTTDASLALKALKTNVLELDNTTSFTPTADYHPSTKKYVDDTSNAVASDAEAQAGTSTTRVMNVKQVDDNYGVLIRAGTTYLVGEANTERTSTSTSMILVKEILCRAAGTYTISYQASSNQTGGSSGDRTNESQIFKNGSTFGTLNTNTAEPGAPLTYAENLTFADGDLIQIYYRYTGGAGASARVLNYSVKYDLVGFNKYTGTVNTD